MSAVTKLKPVKPAWVQCCPWLACQQLPAAPEHKAAYLTGTHGNKEQGCKHATRSSRHSRKQTDLSADWQRSSLLQCDTRTVQLSSCQFAQQGGADNKSMLMACLFLSFASADRLWQPSVPLNCLVTGVWGRGRGVLLGFVVLAVH